LAEIWKSTLNGEDPKRVIVPDDFGDGSLRHALSCAQPGDIVIIDEVLTDVVITIQDPYLHIYNQVAVICNPLQNVQIKVAEGVERLIEIHEDGDFTIVGLSLVGGQAQQGNVILNRGKLTLDNMQLFNNPDLENRASGVYDNDTGHMTILNNTVIKE
jgi:hypothetical protein